MYPQGHHPVATMYLPDGRTPVFPLPRSMASVKYYYVDFGISVSIPADVFPKLAQGTAGRDREPPELSSMSPYDPFKLDVFIIGNLFRREFHDNFSNVDFLLPLISVMTEDDPAARPTAAEVYELWKKLRPTVSVLHGKWRLRYRDEGPVVGFIFDVVHSIGAIFRFTRQLFRWSVDLQG